VNRPATPPAARWQATFGPFLLSPDERLLQRDGVPVRLGGRALDLLVVLVENAGAVVNKNDLLARVWRDVVVDEGSLRFHMHAVRKALGDGVAGTRYVVNTANKGYTFVAAVERQSHSAEVPAPTARPGTALPALGSTIVGRSGDIDAIVTNLLQRRLVSVVGAGGIGKTTVAIASIQAAAEHFAHDVHFVDLAQVGAMGSIRAAVAHAVGLQNGQDELPLIAAHLAERKALIVLDCCEHVVVAAAELTEWLVRHCPFVHILATSREALRAEGEFVYRLPPLAFPPPGEGATARAALAYPAVQLFVERAAASGAGFELKDSDALLASQLCRELDGIALAIELAAGRIEALGLQAITSHFDASARLMWHGRRTAVPRHQTLGATLDWSFQLLTDSEKRLLRRLSVFAGSFALDAALDVCCFDSDPSEGVELLAGLVSKSLVNVDAGGAALRYGLLDTTKSYGGKRLEVSGEAQVLAERFSQFYGQWATRQAAHPLGKEALDTVRLELPNLGAAMAFHFRDDAHLAAAVELAASFCPLLLQLSLLKECARWAQAALDRMPTECVGSHAEVRLRGALGQSLMFIGGDGDEADTAFRRGIQVSEDLGDPRSTLHLLNGHALLLHRDGRFTEALATARKAQALLPALDDPECRAIVDSLMGVALHLVGHVQEAMGHWQRVASHGAGASTDTTSRLGFDYHIRAMCGVARSLWLTGHYAEAVAVADETIAKARDCGHAVTYCIALIWAGSVHVHLGNVAKIRELADTVEAVARRHSLTPYLGIASATRGQILVIEGRPADGVELIRRAVETLRVSRYEMVTTVFLTTMARGLSDLSLHAASLTLCDDIAQRIETGGDRLRLSELLTTRGRVLVAAGRPEEARESYLSAIAVARSQGVKPLQVRAAVALAQLLIRMGHAEEADPLLRPHVIAAGDETSADLVVARGLLC